MKLYSNNCIRCKQLKALLDKRGFVYDEENDIEKMLALGIESVPVLEVEGEFLDYQTAVGFLMKEGCNEKQ